MILKPGSDSWKQLVDRRQTASVDFFVFNITNEFEVLLGAVPQVEKVGPVSYERYEQYKNASLRADGEVMRYVDDQVYVRRNGTLAAESLPVRVLNPTLPFLRSLLREHAGDRPLLEALIREHFDATHAFVTVPAASLVWGAALPILESERPLFEALRKRYGWQRMPQMNALARNSTLGGSAGGLQNATWSEMLTGLSDPARAGELQKYQNDSFSLRWREPVPVAPGRLGLFGVGAVRCPSGSGRQGTAAGSGPDASGPSPGPLLAGDWAVRPSDEILVFSPVAARPLGFVCSQDAPAAELPAALSGLKRGLLRFVQGSQDYANATMYPPNANFWQLGPGGVFNLTMADAKLPPLPVPKAGDVDFPPSPSASVRLGRRRPLGSPSSVWDPAAFARTQMRSRRRSLQLWRERAALADGAPGGRRRPLRQANATKDVPVFQSQPYFLGAPAYAANNTLMGLPPPDASRDSSVLYVEPATGVGVYVRATAQFAVEMHDMGFVLGLDELAKVMVPVAYEVLEQSVDGDSVASLELLVGPAHDSGTAMVVVGCASFAALLALHAWLLVKHRCPPHGAAQCCGADCRATSPVHAGSDGLTEPLRRDDSDDGAFACSDGAEKTAEARPVAGADATWRSAREP
jgi:hypothetical protein